MQTGVSSLSKRSALAFFQFILLFGLAMTNWGMAGTVISFSEELRISGEEYAWSGGDVSFDVDRAGNIYVANHSENQIVHFGPDGEERGRIGKKGEGPGEFFQLRGFFCFDDGSFAALDLYLANRSIHYFDKNFKPLKKSSFKLDGSDYHSFPLFARNGAYLFASQTTKGNPMKRQDVLFSVAKKPVLTLCKSEYQRIGADKKFYGTKSWYPAQIRNFFWRDYAERAIVAFGEQRIYVAWNHEYKVQVYDDQLQLLTEVERAYKPDMIRNAHFKVILESILASYQGDYRNYVSVEDVEKGWALAGEKVDLPPILDVIPLGERGFLVIRDADPETFETRADFFDGSGRFRGNVNLPKMYVSFMSSQSMRPAKMLARGDKIYVMEPDEDFEFSVVRYGYKIKDQ